MGSRNVSALEADGPHLFTVARHHALAYLHTQHPPHMQTLMSKFMIHQNGNVYSA